MVWLLVCLLDDHPFAACELDACIVSATACDLCQLSAEDLHGARCSVERAENLQMQAIFQTQTSLGMIL